MLSHPLPRPREHLC